MLKKMITGNAWKGTKNRCKRNIKMLETYGKHKEFKV
jgi:hypothetical protein